MILLQNGKKIKCHLCHKSILKTVPRANYFFRNKKFVWICLGCAEQEAAMFMNHWSAEYHRIRLCKYRLDLWDDKRLRGVRE
jgi:RNase P subunit RPR2